MMDTTLDMLKVGLRIDPSLTPAERNRILAVIRNHGRNDTPAENREPRLVRRSEAARRLGIGLRALDGLCRNGALPKVKLPGRIRACGIRESDLLALIEGGSHDLGHR